MEFSPSGTCSSDFLSATLTNALLKTVTCLLAFARNCAGLAQHSAARMAPRAPPDFRPRRRSAYRSVSLSAYLSVCLARNPARTAMSAEDGVVRRAAHPLPRFPQLLRLPLLPLLPPP
jgi:hypothetical protein